MKLVKDDTYDFLFRAEGSGTWYVRKTEKGRKPLFKTTGESKSKGRAKERALDLIAQWKGQVRVREEAIMFRDVAAIVTNNKKNLRDSTREKYVNQFEVLLPYFGDRRIEQVDEQAWEQFIYDRRQKREDYSFATTLAVLRDVINRAFERKLIERKPKFRDPDKDRESSGRVFSRSEMIKIMRFSAPRSGRYMTRKYDTRHAIQLAYYEALRRGDVTKISWDRIDFAAGTLHFTKAVTKNKKERTIPLERKTLAILRRRQALIGDTSPWVFPARGNPQAHAGDFDEGFKGALERAGIAPDARGVKGRFHDIRRSALTDMFRTAKNHLMVCYLRDLSVEVAMEKYIRWSVDELKGWRA